MKTADGYQEYTSKAKENNYQLSPLYNFPLSSANNTALLSFVPQGRFTRVSFLDVYQQDSFESLQQKINFENAIVLVGMTADGTKDIFITPNGKDYGVYVHANMINTVLQ